jgi:dTDP-4-dehydrorhamnose 3,5-epimerase
MPMKVEFVATEIPDVLEVHGQVARDDRGFFTELHSQRAWSNAGFKVQFVQDNLSESRRGVLRGLHYQINPRAMSKLVRVLRGSIFDVAVDLRRGSPTFGRWVGRELSAANGAALWVPAGFGHGFLALEDSSLVLYKCTGFHAPETERSLNYADPQLGIEWPFLPTHLSQKDADAPMLAAADYNFDYTE